MSITKAEVAEYANAAFDLAESVKRNIAKDNKIDNKTVIALNRFTIIANKIEDLNKKLTDDENESNTKLN